MKNLFYSAMALFTMLMASCSQEEILSDNGQETKSPITISVNAPVAALTRAAVTLPSGYSMKCIMQLLDEANAMVGSQKEAAVDAGSGTATFTITVADQATAKKALFWAEFRPTSGEKVYDTADLKAVKYSTTSFDMSNEALMAACDAFCGNLEVSSSNTSVTLKRPFAKVSLNAKNPEEVPDEAKVIKVEYKAPSAFNVLDNTTDENEVQQLTYTNESFDASKAWFSNLIFAPTTQTDFDQPITITLLQSDGTTPVATKTIQANEIPLDDNKEVDADFDYSNEASDINVTIDVDGGYEQLPLEVGSYINAAGKVVSSASEAIAVVYALAGDDITDTSDYGEGKEAKAYAISLKAATGRSVIDNQMTEREFVTTDDNYNGYTYSSTLINTIKPIDATNNKVFNEYLAAIAKEEFKLTGANLSSWYIPSSAQLLEAQNKTDETLQNNLNQAASGQTKYYLLSSSTLNDSSEKKYYYGVLYTKDTTENATKGTPGTKAEKLLGSTSVVIFPALTIFE